MSNLKKSTQALVNRYARLRDCAGTGGATCISCYQWFPFDEGDGGHYRPTTHSATRFMEENVHFQCHRCNRYLHANLTGYFRGLEQKIGRERLDALDAIPREHVWTRQELEDIKQYYKEKIKKLESGEYDGEIATDVSVLDMFSDL